MDDSHYLRSLAEESTVRAMARYHNSFDGTGAHLYRVATKNRSNRYANLLIDAALALCGHPSYSLNYSRKWSKAALAYLAHVASFAR